MKNLKIMIIEDNQKITNVFKRFLERHEYFNYRIILEGKNAYEAIKKFKPDIIFLDTRLGDDITGIEILRKVRNNKLLDKIYIAVISAYAQKEDIAANMDVGANIFLAKPIDPDRMIDEIKKVEASMKSK